MIKIKTTAHMPKDGGFLEDYTWIRLLKKDQQLQPVRQRALFLDRDGIINVEKGYITHRDMFEIEQDIAHVIRYYNAKKWPVIIVTNQSGIGKEKLSWAKYWQIEDRMIQDAAALGAFFDLILASPCHPQAVAPYNHPNAPSRKPNPGMIYSAAHLLGLDLQRSFIVGDRLRDLQAGYHGGLKQGIFRDSHHREGHQEWLETPQDIWDGFDLKKVQEIHEILPIIKDKFDKDQNA